MTPIAASAGGVIIEGADWGDFSSKWWLRVCDDGSISVHGRVPLNTELATVPDLRGIRATAVSTSLTHAVALLNDGDVIAWGDQQNRGINLPNRGGRRAVAIAAGDSHSIIVLEDGRLNIPDFGGQRPTRVATGKLHSQDIPDLGGRRVVDISCSAVSMGDQHTLILYRDGGVAAWFQKDLPPDEVSAWERDFPAAERRITHVAAGDVGRSVFLLNNGEVLTCGGAIVELGEDWPW
eukprot:gene5882-15143_t